ncbi:MAG TPA: hypothetical protein PLZ55_09825 [bacterium]|nr:hypothetical protein [bacterium]HQO33374.1 hypothetical protein [bacterium]
MSTTNYRPERADRPPELGASIEREGALKDDDLPLSTDGALKLEDRLGAL